MPLPLPYVISDPQVQGNFDKIASQPWPASNMGIFSVYRNAALNIATNVVVLFDTEEYDTSNWYDPTTGRFTPQRAGYYRLSWGGTLTVAAGQFYYAQLEKSAAIIQWGIGAVNNAVANTLSQGTANVFANGTTDFFDVRFNHNTGGAAAVTTGRAFTFFQGELIAP